MKYFYMNFHVAFADVPWATWPLMIKVTLTVYWKGFLHSLLRLTATLGTFQHICLIHHSLLGKVLLQTMMVVFNQLYPVPDCILLASIWCWHQKLCKRSDIHLQYFVWACAPIWLKKKSLPLSQSYYVILDCPFVCKWWYISLYLKQISSCSVW